MEHIDKVKRGVAMFVDRELVPTFPKWKGILFAAGMGLFIETNSKALLNHPVAGLLGLVDGEQVDVEKAYAAVKNKAQSEWPITIAGFRCQEDDLDKLYRYIRDA